MKYTHARLLADLGADAPAKTPRPERPRLTVPQMPPLTGDGCCWGCKPGDVKAKCLVHGPVYRPV